MGYNKTQWVDRNVQYPTRYTDELGNVKTFTPSPGTVTQTGTQVTAQRMNNLETGVMQNNLFNLLLDNEKYKVTEFDTPSSGDITETIKLKSDNSTYATIVTEFDTPSAGDITTKLTCTALGISNKVVTEFDTPSSGDITETGGVI